MNTELDQRITFNPRKCGGQACIRGLRIRVTDILEMLAQGVDQSEILADFPGKTRREALKAMGDRLGIPEVSSFVAAIIQSEMLGVSMARVLRIQWDQMRVKRR